MDLAFLTSMEQGSRGRVPSSRQRRLELTGSCRISSFSKIEVAYVFRGGCVPQTIKTQCQMDPSVCLRCFCEAVMAPNSMPVEVLPSSVDATHARASWASDRSGVVPGRGAPASSSARHTSAKSRSSFCCCQSPLFRWRCRICGRAAYSSKQLFR